MGDMEKLEKEIEEIISRSPLKTDPIHSKTTREWLFKLKPWADIPTRIAALAHDIERGFQKEKIAKRSDNLEEDKREHSERSAKIIVDLMKKHGFDESSIKKTERIILFHEFGGDENANYLRDADFLSFFENNLELYYALNGKERTVKKIKTIFDKMSHKAKELLKKIQFKPPKIKKIVSEITGY